MTASNPGRSSQSYLEFPEVMSKSLRLIIPSLSSPSGHHFVTISFLDQLDRRRGVSSRVKLHSSMADQCTLFSLDTPSSTFTNAQSVTCYGA